MLNKNTQIALIAETATSDQDGFSVVTEIRTEIWALIDSITGTEFYQTGLLNIRPSCRAVIWTAEYSGQELVEIDGKRYKVYRTFKRNQDETELYLEEKVGVNV